MKRKNKIILFLVLLYHIIIVIFAIYFRVDLYIIQKIKESINNTFILDNENYKEYKKQGKENAVNYIKRKYGIDAEVVNVYNMYINNSPAGIPFDSLANNVAVELKAKEKDNNFFVIINGSTITDEGQDNYQYDEILNDISTIMKNEFPNMYNCEISYSQKWCEGKYINGIIDFYYDGTNLSELKYRQLDINVNFINEESIKDYNVNNMLNVLNFNDYMLYLYNFKSVNDYEEYCNETDYPLSHINEIVKYQKNNDNINNFGWFNYKDNLYKVNDMYIYAVKDVKQFDYYQELASLSIEKANTDWYGYNTINETIEIKKENANEDVDIYISVPKSNYKKGASLASITKNKKILKAESFYDNKNYYECRFYNSIFDESDSFIYSIIDYNRYKNYKDPIWHLDGKNIE